MNFRIKAISAAVMILAAHQATAGDITNKAAIDRALGVIQQNSSTFKLSTASASNKTLGVAADALPSASGDQFKAKDVIVDRDGTEHVRFNRFYNGLPVIGGDTVVHSYHGQLKHASLSQTAAINLTQTVSSKTAGDVKANITAAAAKAIAVKSFRGTVKEALAPKLVVFARNSKPTLAYQVSVSGEESRLIGTYGVTAQKSPKLSLIYIAADSGAVLDREELIQHLSTPPTTPPSPTPTNVVAAAGTGKTLLFGNVVLNNGKSTDTLSKVDTYYLIDPTRGSGTVKDAQNAAPPVYVSDIDKITKGATYISKATNTFGDNTTADRATAAADIAFGVAKTWDFYQTLGRNGIFNDGKGVTSYAHIGTGYTNAFWADSAKSMFYGDGSSSQGTRPVVAVDVAGHEMTHGVTSATAALVYNDRDSGGLNEGSSDILGTSVEFSVATISHPANYLIGEDVYTAKTNADGTPKAIRYMFKPSLDRRTVTFNDGTTGPIGSFDCYKNGGFTSAGEKFFGSNNTSIYDAHFTSGVANRFYYLLSEGAVVPAGFTSKLAPSDLVCNGNTALVAIGRDKVTKIWYKALSQYFTSGTTYPQARIATLNAATDLYGANSVEYNAVAAAWSAVSVN